MRLLAGFKDKRLRLFAAVEHDSNNHAVRIPESSGQQIASCYPGTDATRPAPNESRKIAEIKVGALIEQLVLPGMGDNWSAAEVRGVIRAAGFIEEQVPIDPPDRAATEIVDHIEGVMLSNLPLIEMRPFFLATFGEDQLFSG